MTKLIHFRFYVCGRWHNEKQSPLRAILILTNSNTGDAFNARSIDRYCINIIRRCSINSNSRLISKPEFLAYHFNECIHPIHSTQST